MGLEALIVHVEVTTATPEPVSVRYDDQGTSALGDDQVTVFQDLERASVRVDAPGDPVEAGFDFRDPVMEHPVFATGDQGASRVRAALPPEARARFDAGSGPDAVLYYQYDLVLVPGMEELVPASRFRGELPYVPTPTNVARVTYDRVYLHPGYGNSSDEYIETVEAYQNVCYLGTYHEGLFGESRCVTREIPQPYDEMRAALPTVSPGFRVWRVEVAAGSPGPPAAPAEHGGQGAPGKGTPAGPANALPREDRPGAPIPPADHVPGNASPPAPRGMGASIQASAIRSPIVLASHPLPLIALALAWAAAPLLVWLLYHRLRRADVEHQGTRVRLLEAVRADPGVTEKVLARRLGLPHSLVDYHARLLADHGLLVVRHVGGRKRLFPPGGEQGIAALRPALEQGRARDLLACLAANPGVTLTRLASLVRMRPSSAHWHVQRLQAMGLVAATRQGREVHLALAPERKAAVWCALERAGSQPRAASEPLAAPGRA